MTASETTLKAQGPTGNVLERIEQYSVDQPEATEFYIYDELEAQQILLAMAAMIHETVGDVKHEMDREQYKEIARKYRKAVIDEKAMELFREMTEEDQLVILGLKLKAPNITIQ